jgi:predicted alpha/beta hydrolase family esterase
MAHDLELTSEQLQHDPLILTVRGLDGGGPQHWQALWEAQCSDCRQVDLGTSDFPFRNNWVNRLNLAIMQARRPVVIVAHGLGCHAVAWWAEYERPLYGNPVVGALLAAPPDVDRADVGARLARFAPSPRSPLPFPSYLAASRDDPACDLHAAQLLASDWGSRFAYAGAAGGIDCASGVGDWVFGKRLLAQLLREHRLEVGREVPAERPVHAIADARRARARADGRAARHT